MSTIYQWLNGLGLEQYAALFAANAIDEETLNDLTEADLKELGIEALGHRKKLLKAIAALSSDPLPQLENTSAEQQVERRQVTVLFCDMVDSTALSVRLDAEDFRDIVTAYLDRCGRVIAQCSGFVGKYYGDGLLAYFGYPRAHEHDPELAVRAGLNLIAATRAMRSPGGVEIQSRIGIATGEVIIGDLIGQGAAQERTVVGEAPNLGARLQVIAEPNTVLIADNTRRLLGDLFDYKDIGYRHLKGFSKPMRAWQVLAERPLDSRFATRQTDMDVTRLVGRETECRQLLTLWDKTKQGRGQAALLIGEAGIGKSRLAQAIADHLQGETHILLRYYCAPYYKNSALYPVINRLQKAARISPADPLADKLGKLAAYLAGFGDDNGAGLPLMASLLSIPEDAIPGVKIPLSAQRRKEKTLELLLAQLMAYARSEPMLLVYEDLHWSDPTSLELLERLLDCISEQPIFLLMTARAGLKPSWLAGRDVCRIEVERLEQEQMMAIVRHLTGGKTLPADLLARLIGKADGVPLFVEEMTKAVLEAGFLRLEGERYVVDKPLPPMAVPSSLRDSLTARLDRLGAVKEVAQLGAVIGRQFNYELIAALMLAKCSEAELAAALKSLVDAELLYCRGAPPDAVYTFKHALVQDAAYASLLRDKRRRLHAQIAQVLEQQFPAIAETEPELIAQHYTAAQLSRQALDFWLLSGQRAIARSAYIEAINHLDSGLAELERLPGDATEMRLALRLHTLRAGALQATRGYTDPLTAEAYTQARELCRQLGDAAELFPALRGIFTFHALRAEYKIAGEMAAECLRLARRQHDSGPHSFAHGSAGLTFFMTGELQRAREHLEQAVAHYDPVGHRRSAAIFTLDLKTRSLAFLCLTECLLGYPDRGLRIAQSCIAHARELGHVFNLAVAISYASRIWALRREYDTQRKQADSLHKIAHEHHLAHSLRFAKIHLGRALIGLEQYADGIKHLRAGIEENRTAGTTMFMPIELGALAEAQTMLGQQQQGMDCIAEALALSAKTQESWSEAELYRIQGEILRRTGDTPGAEIAEQRFLHALGIARRQGARFWELRAATGIARLWADQGKRRQAVDLLAPVLSGFTEGFATIDVRYASDLLEELK